MKRKRDSLQIFSFLEKWLSWCFCSPWSMLKIGIKTEAQMEHRNNKMNLHPISLQSLETANWHSVKHEFKNNHLVQFILSMCCPFKGALRDTLMTFKQHLITQGSWLLTLSDVAIYIFVQSLFFVSPSLDECVCVWSWIILSRTFPWMARQRAEMWGLGWIEGKSGSDKNGSLYT